MVQEIDVIGTHFNYCRGPSRRGNLGVAIALGKQIDTFSNLLDNFINTSITEYLSIMIMISAVILTSLVKLVDNLHQPGRIVCAAG